MPTAPTGREGKSRGLTPLCRSPTAKWSDTLKHTPPCAPVLNCAQTLCYHCHWLTWASHTLSQGGDRMLLRSSCLHAYCCTRLTLPLSSICWFLPSQSVYKKKKLKTKKELVKLSCCTCSFLPSRAVGRTTRLFLSFFPFFFFNIVFMQDLF